MGATAGIVVIGDEILSGKFADENAAFLIGELRSLGVDLRRISVIPDDLDDIADTVVRFSGKFTYVFTSGGVGPTHDDLTMAGIARGFGTRVVQAPELEEKVRAYWGEKLAPANLRLAQVPEGAELVYGDAVWPVVSYKNVFILPGVPTLFRRKFLEIRERFRATPVVVARVYAGCDEGVLAPELDAVVAAFPGVKIGSYPRFEEKDFKVLLTVEAVDGGVVREAVEMLVKRLGELVVKVTLPET
ncbi:MAG: competence/damage-inducible protein A [Deltaproteobacteria bacterium]|nr:competence/damage-inducible protein A [Kofleriaceae bacterium]